MKTNHGIQVLLGLLLASRLCAAPVPQPDVLDFANDFSVIGGVGEGHTSKSSAAIFAASGTVSSELDGSSVNAAQSSSYSVGTFTASGSVNLNTGRFEGSNSVSVAGETSIYIIFEVTNTSHYQFASSFSVMGNVSGNVDFNGLNNPGGDVMASGTLLPGGLYDIQAEMGVGTNVTGGHGKWSYSLSITPTNVMAGRFTAAQKADFYSQVSVLSSLADQLAAAAKSGGSDELRDKLLEAAQGLFDLADKLSQDYADPLDTNYTVLPEVVAPTVTPLASGGGITLLEAQNYNAWLTNLSQLEGYNTALTTAINRAQGAQFEGDSGWETAQMNAAVQFEAHAATLFDQEPALRSNMVAQFASGGFAAIAVTAADALQFQMEIDTNGLPTNFVEDLTELGADPQTITNFQNAILTQDPADMSGGFPGSLSNPNLDAAQLATAGGLRDASLVMINPALLPTGQFRFDLPTEPGYTYTIQSRTSLTDPGGWTTLLSNKVTTALLSFTNTPSGSAKSAFYRASHN